MKTSTFTLLLAAVLLLSSTLGVEAQTLFETDINKFGVSGYLRSGFGYSADGSTQAHFQMPGALNKYSLGNQADTYGELEFDYTHYLNNNVGELNLN